MTVDELIAKLEELPGNLQVVMYDDVGYRRIEDVDPDVIYWLKEGHEDVILLS